MSVVETRLRGVALVSGIYAKNSLGWQVQELSRRVGEWLERLLSRGSGELPQESPLPEWLLQALFWLLLLTGVGWLVWQLFKLLQPYLSASSKPTEITPAPIDPNWLKQAQIAHSQGDYRAACRALYLAALQRLNERGLIPQAISRTDGEYLTLLQQLRLPDAYNQPYQLLIRTHERLAFDQFAASADLYDRCWQAYRQLEEER